MSRRFQGAESSEILGQSGVLNQDMIQVRHSVGTSDDSDKGLPLSVIQSCPVATCETAGSTVAKVGTVANFPDFTLLNGREVLVYFASGNTATSPTFNLNNTGAYPLALENQASSVSIGSGSWGNGVFLHLKFVDITISGTQIQKWVICGHDIAQQTSDYTIYADGRTIYSATYNEDITSQCTFSENDAPVRVYNRGGYIAIIVDGNVSTNITITVPLNLLVAQIIYNSNGDYLFVSNTNEITLSIASSHYVNLSSVFAITN